MPNAGYYAQRIGQSPKKVQYSHPGWDKGKNSFSEDNETRDDEFYDSKNIEIVGRSSIQMPRRGSELFAQISGGTSFNGWGIYKNPKTSDNYLIVQVSGKVYKVSTSGQVTEIDVSKSWDTSAKMRGVLLRENFYFGNAVDFMSKTDGSTITQWNSVTAIENVLASVTSAATDDTLYEYCVTAVTANGETEFDNAEVTSDFAPSTLGASDYIDITFNRKTDVEVTGYNIYKAVNGRTLLLLDYIDQPTSGATVTYRDDGTVAQSLIYEAPTFNTTGGVKGNIYAKYANTLFVAGNLQEPDAVFYGGTGDKFESFSPSDNGGWFKPGRGDGERVTAMIGFDDFLFIFKESSIWKFVFDSSSGAPTLTAVIPQYGTNSPDTVWRMEKDVVFLGSDGRYRVLGYEPTQLNVIRTADISNRIQPDLDTLPKTNLDDFHAAFYEQKYIVCNQTVAYPYDRRYTAFLGEWTAYNYDKFIVWDKGTGKELLFGAESGTGKIKQLLVDNEFEDEGESIESYIRFKRLDGDVDFIKYWDHTKWVLKNAKGNVSVLTFKDGSTLQDATTTNYDSGGGVFDGMFGEFMWGDGDPLGSVADQLQLLEKRLEFEAYSIYHLISISGSNDNNLRIQRMSGMFEYEDIDYKRDETLI